MSNKTKTVELVPTWAAATEMMILALENGSEEGKQIAREELRRMAGILDEIKARQDAP